MRKVRSVRGAILATRLRRALIETLIAVGLAALLVPNRAEPQQLTVDAVPIPLGAEDAPIVAKLRERGPVFPLGDGWEIRPDSSPSVRPHVRIRTRQGIIWRVILTWGPPMAPEADALLAYVIEGLPGEAQCAVRTGSGPLEGGISRGLSWKCGRYSGEVGTGAWPTGRTAIVAITLD
jgi:hypothetical protein